MTFPSGWTVDFNQAESSYARLTLFHKATASDTSAAISASAAFTIAVYFFEVSGSHALDQSSTSGQAIAYSVVLPGITPTANSACWIFGGRFRTVRRDACSLRHGACFSYSVFLMSDQLMSLPAAAEFCPDML